MDRKQIIQLYIKYLLVSFLIAISIFSVQLILNNPQFDMYFSTLLSIAAILTALISCTIVVFRRLYLPAIVSIYIKYIVLSLLIVESFFSIQVIFVLKEFKPQFALVPTLLGLIIGLLVSTVLMFKQQLQKQHTDLGDANNEIHRLNKQLKADNVRMGSELAVTQQLQQMLLPKAHELEKIKELDITGFMEPTDEVGGDYYDVLQHENGPIKIGIGDVTGHGLESGVLMVMVQMAVRTLLTNKVSDPTDFLNLLNQAIFKNVQRMNSDKNLTLSLIDYEAGILHLTGQHEDVLVVRKNGEVERIDTTDLGFMVGLEPDISKWVAHSKIELTSGDGVVLYTDGITEARNSEGRQYGVDALCKVVSKHWQEASCHIVDKVIDDLKSYIGDCKVHDDITLLVCKQR
ncbi:PP2C family protein-serine/threonine phosphatase [Candidatus Venteria ishoeyi]|uniref:PP2C family protein-serine/threonine phosphatase n=1 Tax=Candidatus Venteria ishoeyi TaxID=1899563 RepID=UPI0025A5CF2D|nr:PP2C family protein-serine/threonine phosphatase [Candidatus Venteria ishoeyi]MDM8545102.1 PP2C family protein-serine/threonine phosphatase [Candidatus Venteria ishoeyi]